MMKNKEIKHESDLEQAIEKHRYDEARHRQLKIEYDELKFQFNRYKIFKDTSSVNENRYDNIYDMSNQINSVQKTQGYVPDRYRPLASPPVVRKVQKEEVKVMNMTQIDTTAAVSDFSEKLYRKNMASTVGDLLRWDSQNGVYSNNKSGHNKVRSVSNPSFHDRSRSRY
jgi:hypothetical protein